MSTFQESYTTENAEIAWSIAKYKNAIEFVTNHKTLRESYKESLIAAYQDKIYCLERAQRIINACNHVALRSSRK